MRVINLMKYHFQARLGILNYLTVDSIVPSGEPCRGHAELVLAFAAASTAPLTSVTCLDVEIVLTRKPRVGERKTSGLAHTQPSWLLKDEWLRVDAVPDDSSAEECIRLLAVVFPGVEHLVLLGRWVTANCLLQVGSLFGQLRQLDLSVDAQFSDDAVRALVMHNVRIGRVEERAR